MTTPLLAVVTAIYAGVAWGYFKDNDPGMGFMFVGYAFANLGLIYHNLVR